MTFPNIPRRNFWWAANIIRETEDSTEEGEVRWVAREDVPKMELAYDMLNLLRVFEEDQLSELFYRERLENDFIREFW